MTGPRGAKNAALHATGLSVIVAALNADTDGVGMILDDLNRDELRYVAEAQTYVAMFGLLGSGINPVTAEHLDGLITGLRQKIAELRAAAQ